MNDTVYTALSAGCTQCRDELMKPARLTASGGYWRCVQCNGSYGAVPKGISDGIMADEYYRLMNTVSPLYAMRPVMFTSEGTGVTKEPDTFEAPGPVHWDGKELHLTETASAHKPVHGGRVAFECTGRATFGANAAFVPSEGVLRGRIVAATFTPLLFSENGEETLRLDTLGGLHYRGKQCFTVAEYAAALQYLADMLWQGTLSNAV